MTDTLVNQKLVIKTEVLQDLTSKAVKVCSFMDSFMITGLLSLTASEGKLTIITTDNVNTIKLQKTVEPENNIKFVVDAKLFSALVGKITTPLTEITVEGNKVLIKANGKYDLPLITEEDGTHVELPEYEFDRNANKHHLNNYNIKSILSMNKACKADMKEVPALFNYYLDSNRVLTCDFYKLCNNPVIAFDSPVCLPPEIMELVPLIADDKGVDVQQNENTVLFSSTVGELFGRKAVQEDLDAYPVDSIIESLNEACNGSCKINRTLLSNALDRVCLFVESFDNNCVTLTFDNEKVTLTTRNNNTKESIKYLEPKTDITEFTINVDAVFLRNQLEAIPKEDIVLKFGNEHGIQIICDDIVQVSSSLGDE